MSSVPPPQNNNPYLTPNRGSGPQPPLPPPQPPRQSALRRARDWFSGLSEGGKIALIGAVITTVGGGAFGVINTVIPVLADGGKEDKPEGKSKPSAQAPKTPGETVTPSPQEQDSQAPSSTPSSQAPASSYELVYEDRKVGISKPAGWDFGTLDLDQPRAQTFGSAEYKRMREDAEAKGKLVEPDLLYRTDAFTELVIEEGRTAVFTESSPPPQPEQCAADAEAGGFDAMRMTEWPAEVGSGFCLITDQGNVVRLQITRFVGGDRTRITGHPDRIEFSATMWRARES